MPSDVLPNRFKYIIDAGDVMRGQDNPALLGATDVAVSAGSADYGASPPYSPAKVWPEYPFRDAALESSSGSAYGAVRTAFRLLGLDRDNLDRAEWNPLRNIVRPGDTVVLKPNFVREFRETRAGHADCVFTHGAVIRAVMDYAYIALGGTGRIIVADAPQNDADFGALRHMAGLDAIREFYHRHAGFDVEIYDLRQERAKKIDGVIVGHQELVGDPAGYVAVNLGRNSAFTDVNHLCHLFYGSEYESGELHRHHQGDVHEYLVSKTVLGADVVISLPKLKTHKKVGLTVNMKNLVGINGDKNWLPHHREGSPVQGGDQFADNGWGNRIERSTVSQFKRLFPLLGPMRGWVAQPIKSAGTRIFGDTHNGKIRSGNWYGNDTTWRMVVDLNRILLYAGADGRLQNRLARRFFSVVDGIVAGERNGPLDPIPKPAGVIIAGLNPVAVDLACCRLMGFDHERVPMFRGAFNEHALPMAAFQYDDVIVHSNDTKFDGSLNRVEFGSLGFEPHFGWRGHIEKPADCAGGSRRVDSR